MSGLDLTYVSDTSTVSDSLKGEEGMPPKPELFEFDPNLATGEMFHALGLASWQIQIIERYRIKGGKFRNAEDFGKIYGIGVIQFENLKPYIRITKASEPARRDSSQKTSWKRVNKPAEIMCLVELNSCDSIELDNLKGIGKSSAARIIKYRNRLGGFFNAQQLMEVYGFRKEMLEAIMPRIRIDSSRVHKIYLNKVDYSELRKHPYLTAYQAKNLCLYRDKQKFKQLDEIRKNNLLSTETFDKIMLYLSLE